MGHLSVSMEPFPKASHLPSCLPHLGGSGGWRSAVWGDSRGSHRGRCSSRAGVGQLWDYCPTRAQDRGWVHLGDPFFYLHDENMLFLSISNTYRPTKNHSSERLAWEVPHDAFDTGSVPGSSELLFAPIREIDWIVNDTEIKYEAICIFVFKKNKNHWTFLHPQTQETCRNQS